MRASPDQAVTHQSDREVAGSPVPADRAAERAIDQPSPQPGHDRTRFAFLAETSRLLACSLDLEPTLATVAGIALPHFGAWCMVDVIEPGGAISRVAVIHPDAARQRRAREYYAAHPPRDEDPIGAARVIRTSESAFVVVSAGDALAELADDTHRELLRELGARSFLIVPMRARNRSFGAITFVSDEDHHYDDADLLLAEDLGRRCAIAIDNARLYAEADAARAEAERMLALAEAAREEARYAAQRADALRTTAEHARQEAEVANKAKESFLTLMSHEFRTPLGIVLGYVGLLRDGIGGPMNETQRMHVRRIEAASRHLLTLIEEILTLSQVNAGHGEPRLEDVDVTALLEEASALLSPIAHAKKLSLTVHAPATPIVLATDPGKFRQIVFNLTSNAIKWTKAGGIELGLSDEGDAVRLRVTDTGTGISAADAEHLFESFWQSRAVGTAGRTGGTGLGLSITRQLAQLLGGDVKLESSTDRGSTFMVTLPYAARRGRDEVRVKVRHA